MKPTRPTAASPNPADELTTAALTMALLERHPQLRNWPSLSASDVENVTRCFHTVLGLPETERLSLRTVVDRTGLQVFFESVHSPRRCYATARLRDTNEPAVEEVRRGTVLVGDDRGVTP